MRELAVLVCVHGSVGGGGSSNSGNSGNSSVSGSDSTGGGIVVVALAVVVLVAATHAAGTRVRENRSVSGRHAGLMVSARDFEGACML